MAEINNPVFVDVNKCIARNVLLYKRVTNRTSTREKQGKVSTTATAVATLKATAVETKKQHQQYHQRKKNKTENYNINWFTLAYYGDTVEMLIQSQEICPPLP